MLTNSPLYASFGVDDIPAAKAFYADTLGVRVIEIGDGLLSLQAGNGYSVLAYIRPGHVPAEHTIINFPVDDIEATVDRLTKAGVTFERYDEEPIKTNEKGIAHPGPWQAWFRDPAGNILSVHPGIAISRPMVAAARTGRRCCRPGRGPWRSAGPRRHPTARGGRHSRQ